jgi:hypothetical protein
MGLGEMGLGEMVLGKMVLGDMDIHRCKTLVTLTLFCLAWEFDYTDHINDQLIK